MLEQKIDQLNISIENLNLKVEALIKVLGAQSEQPKKANSKTLSKQDNVHSIKDAKDTKAEKPETKSKAKPKPEPVENDAKGLSLEDVREALKNVSKTEGKPAALEIMKNQADGATTMSQIEEKAYQDVYDACQEVLQKQAA